MQPEISKKISKSHWQQEIQKKALVSRKLLESQIKNVQKEIIITKKQTKQTKKQMKIKENTWMKFKSKKKI